MGENISLEMTGAVISDAKKFNLHKQLNAI